MRLSGTGDPLAAPPDRGQGEALGGVREDLGARERAAVDRPQREDRVADGRGTVPFRDEAVDDVLDCRARDRRQAPVSEERAGRSFLRLVRIRSVEPISASSTA